MKIKIFTMSILLLIPVYLFAAIDKMDDVAEKFVKDYAARNPQVLFKKNVAVFNFENLSPGVKKYDVGAAVAASLSTELSNSTVFNIVEREKLSKVTDEIELAMTGLVDEKTASQAGRLSGAEYIVVGTVSEIGSDIIVNCRLIDTSTGGVISSYEVSIPRQDVIAESKELYFSAFQSDYGLNIELNPGMLIPVADFDRTDFQLVSFDISYRMFRNTNAGVGYFYMDATEFITERINYDSNTDVHRNFSFDGSGPMIFIEYLHPVFRWFNIGGRVEYMTFITHTLTQDLAQLNVGYVDPDGIAQQGGERVLIESWANEDMIHIIRATIKLEFLISKRLSFHIMGGYLLANDYVPDVYESGGVRHWSESIDDNGHFDSYGSYNFSRFDDGSRVKINLSGYSFGFGLGVHF